MKKIISHDETGDTKNPPLQVPALKLALRMLYDIQKRIIEVEKVLRGAAARSKSKAAGA